MSFLLISSAFMDEGYLPPWYARPGSNFSPPLGWTAPPDGTHSLTLMVKCPNTSFCHWLVYNIPPDERTFWGSIPHEEMLFDGSLQGLNSNGELGWTGPDASCPEQVMHFTMYALDTMLDLASGAELSAVEEAIEGHVLAKTELIAQYRPH